MTKPALLRKPRRLTIPVSNHVYQKLLSDSDLQGRLLSNDAAFMLEASLQRQATFSLKRGEEASMHLAASPHHTTEG